MIFGAGVFQIAAIQTAKRMGLEVVAIDANCNAPGLPLATYHEIVSTTDAETALEVARRYGVNGVMTMATDTCVPAVAYIAEMLGLTGIGIPTALNATNKYRMRQAFKAAEVPSTLFEKVANISEVRSAVDRIGLPVMLKLPDSSGSRGINKITNMEQLEPLFIRAMKLTKCDFVLMEQFIEGIEVGGETFFWEGKPLMLFITNKAITPPPYYVPYGHSLPSRLDKNTQCEIQKVVHYGSQALGIKAGPVNFDLIVTSEGPRIIELGARLGGTCLPSIVKYHSGINTIEAAIIVALGQNPSNLFKISKDVPVAVRLLTSDKDGILTKAKFPEDIDRRPEVLEYTLDVREGDHVKAFTIGANRFGHVICRGRDWQEAERNAESVIGNMQTRIEFELDSYLN